MKRVDRKRRQQDHEAEMIRREEEWHAVKMGRLDAFEESLNALIAKLDAHVTARVSGSEKERP